MDFRTCPACQSSVLEDDVEDCPFCGASMSGKPSAKPKSKPQPSSKPVQKAAPQGGPANAAAQKPAGTKKPAPAKAEAAKGESDDPFDVDTTAVRRAIKLAPKPIKNRTHEVKCPMCETVGYMDPTQGGKDVQCCNPDCIVPVFKSPRVQVEEKPEAPSKSRMPLIVAVSVLGVAAIGAGIFFAIQEEPKPVVQDNEPVKKTDVDTKGLVQTSVKDTGPKTYTEKEIRRAILQDIVEITRIQDIGRNRNPAMTTQLASATFAAAGKLTEAQDQLKLLQSKGNAPNYYQILPLVEIAWQQLSRQETAAANESATIALEKARQMSKYARDSHDAAIALGGLLVALGRAGEAEAVISQHQESNVKGELSARWRAAVESRSFDMDLESILTWHLSIPEPLRMGIIETLVARGKADEALAFAQTTQDVASKEACLAAWAGRQMIGSNVSAGVVKRIEELASTEGNSPSLTCRVYAAVASATLAQNGIRIVDEMLPKAETALAAVNVPPGPLSLPSKKELYASKGKPFVGLPNPAPAKAAALAACDVAFLRLQRNQPEESWTALTKAMGFARHMSPSPSAATAIYEECGKQSSLVKRDLESVLGLTNQNKLDRAFAQYRQQCQELSQLAGEHLEMRVQLLRTFVPLGLRQQIWDYALASATATDVQERQPFLDTTLPSLLKVFAKIKDENSLASAIDIAYVDRARLEIDPVDALRGTAERLISTGKWKDASEKIKSGGFRGEVDKQHPDRLDALAHRVSGYVMKTASIAESYDFLQNLYDGEFKQDAFLLFAGKSVQQGKASDLWNLVLKARDLNAVDRAATYRGFVSAFGPESNSLPGGLGVPAVPTGAE